MSLIHDEAFKGTLTQAMLVRHLDNDPDCLRSLEPVAGGPKVRMSPLALAAFAGQIDTVTLLLTESSHLDVESGSERYSPLYYAITRAPAASRIAIVNALIDAGANINSCSKDEDDYTPLMFAISRTQDISLVHVLVDRNTELDVKEERSGTTAEALAKDLRIEKELLPQTQRQSSQGELVYYYIAVAMVVYLYAKTAFGGLLKDVLAIPQVRSAVKVATDKFHTDVTAVLKDLGQKLEKGSTKILDTQKQMGGSLAKKSSSPAPKMKASRSKAPAQAVAGGLEIPTLIAPSSTASTPALKNLPLPA